MSSTSASFHGIASISVKYFESGQTGWMTFTFRDNQGGWHDVTAHVERPLQIDGAEMVNLMAAHEEPTGSLVPLLQASIEAAKAKKEAIQS